MEGRFQLPAQGKFNRPDPQRDWNWLAPHTINLYEYVGNDPINAWDPTGFGGQPSPQRMFVNAISPDSNIAQTLAWLPFKAGDAVKDFVKGVGDYLSEEVNTAVDRPLTYAGTRGNLVWHQLQGTKGLAEQAQGLGDFVTGAGDTIANGNPEDLAELAVESAVVTAELIEAKKVRKKRSKTQKKERRKKVGDSSKNEKHGDNGRELDKIKDRMEELQEQVDNAKTKKEKKRIKKKMANIRETALDKRSGTEHGRGSGRGN